MDVFNTSFTHASEEPFEIVDITKLVRQAIQPFPVGAGIVLGGIWGVWHIPAFFIDGLVQASMNFGWFMLGTVSLSVGVTFLFVNANGNAFVSGVAPHLMFNLMFDAHVVLRDVSKVEGLVMVAVAAALVAAKGPSLRGWRAPVRASAPSA